MKKNILFVCIENSSRSQLAQAFAIMHGKEKVNAYSAGSKPSGVINLKAIAAMKELGYDLSAHKSKSLTEIPDVIYDYVITMGCGDECPFIIGHHREEWNIPDPRNMNKGDFRNVRDFIAQKVVSLLGKL
ncbi:MAG: arsenate reductase ArsC [Bacteroidia bacterium]